jgi:decaprenylphospho-beta-D-ribofuranose 2-oxidase
MQIHGWGNYPKIDAEVLEPTSLTRFANELQTNPLIARGMGRSYGDSANAKYVLQTTHLDHYLHFDSKQGNLTCEAGMTLKELLKLIIPKGWFLPVTPGTGFVTIGGAIASDVHGKNHHIVGTFCQHITSVNLLLGTGEIITASPTEKPDLFHATCGGMGLTGVILSATIQLKPIQSSNIKQTTLKANSLEAIYEQFEVHKKSTYSVAWIDCMAKKNKLGRSILMLGEHSDDNQLEVNIRKAITVPVYMPSQLLNYLTVKAFNSIYYTKASHESSATLPFHSYFYPLDKLNDWNKLYGRNGFIQYQFVLPKAASVSGLRKILSKIAESGKSSFLAVLKMFGAQNQNLLSFPIEGYTLTLDFKMNSETVALIKELDAVVVDLGGRIYLTKDALMSEQTFKIAYPQWEQFEKIREKYGAIGRFKSAQSKRLGLL